MLTSRRIFALFLSPFLIVASFAQPAPTEVSPTTISASALETINLNDAIQRALAKNFSIKVSSFDASIASARVTEALGKFDPVLSGSYSYSERFDPQLTNSTTGLRPVPDFSKSDDAEAGIGGLLPWGMTYRLGANSTNTRGAFNGTALSPDNYDTFAGVSGTQPLLRNFGFGSTLASIRIAQANRGISQWQFRADVIDTITAVIFAYNDLNFAYANLRSAVRSRELAASLLSENEKRFRVGSMSQFDVDSARSRVANREESILFAERSVRVSENALKQLITDEKTPTLLQDRIQIEPPPLAPIVVVDAAADFRLALQKRPDYQQAQLALKRDTVNARFQRNQLLPRVDLVGSYGYSGYDRDLRTSRQQIREEEYRAYSWGVVVSVPLTFTTERGRARAAKLQQRQSETTVEQVEQDIVVRVGNAADQIVTTQKRIQATRQARDLAQNTLDAEVKRLRAGQSSTFFVLQQQEILSSLEVSASRAQSDYHKALADYDRQLGVTLEKLNITIETPK
ncbi:TolC family protein [Oleiharenicola lentus]|uniref:TolC family protein n=1 Tax=Oleiharenicola lentus TaxID=2508720 RepID=UPI003F66E55A